MIGAIWVILFLALAGFTGVLIWQRHQVGQVDKKQESSHSNGSIIDEQLPDYSEANDDEISEESYCARPTIS